MNAPARPDLAITIELLGPSLPRPPLNVVAVPVKNEVDRIGGCLTALADQEGLKPGELLVILLLNNCTDGTAEAVRELAPALPFALELRHVDLPCGFDNAGWSRKLAMDAASERIRPGGLILTTDADTLVEQDWVEANRREIASGVDAVAGYVMADPVELMELPPVILERGALEWDYQQLAAELEARADPMPHDPWPRHNQNCGASAAITAQAYRKIGGLPPLRVGEDRALFEALAIHDLKARHSLEVHVVTSARMEGRALGGLSDAIRLRGDPDTPCDEALELAVTTLRRALWRARMRADWKAGRLDVEHWAAKLRLTAPEVQRATERASFGAIWTELEAKSPRLVRRLVTGALLKRELRRMRRLVEAARRAETAWAAELGLAQAVA